MAADKTGGILQRVGQGCAGIAGQKNEGTGDGLQESSMAQPVAVVNYQRKSGKLRAHHIHQLEQTCVLVYCTSNAIKRRPGRSGFPY